ncbi:MAG: tryptophan synthase subunit alpha [Sulfuriflexus sp.]|nr:tryptophan synthase subunit alpha [Sulfuriflexus sp.]
MSRIEIKFKSLRETGRKALIPYVTAGDPVAAVTVPLMHDMVKAGADIIELGVPFSDPMADGPVIQKASERALVHGISLHDVFAMVKEFREKDNETPVVLMGYLNPIEVMGYASFAKQAGTAGVDGVLTVDLPPEEGSEFVAELAKYELDPIFLIAPTTTDARIKKLCSAASGFVYYVSVKGVTGAATLDAGAVADKMTAIRKHTDMPVGVGFGIKDAESAANVGAVADAVVVGSVLVNQADLNQDNPEAVSPAICTILTDIRQALDKLVK